MPVDLCVRDTSLVRQFAEILRRRVTTNDPVGLRIQRLFVDERVKSFARNVCLLARGAWKDVVDIDGFIEIGGVVERLPLAKIPTVSEIPLASGGRPHTHSLTALPWPESAG